MNGKENRLNTDNPYQDSLTGLAIADPVKAFFDWCIEREAMRVRRESGEPPPWTQDPVFQKGRFLNVFREDHHDLRTQMCYPVSMNPSLINTLALHLLAMPKKKR